jgi:superfamily II DNA or RNA helicase
MDPFETFQPQAVAAIVEDFRKNLTGRYLLVIPTGGGKTFTALRAIGQLFATDVLNKDTDRAIWVADQTELLQQAQKALATYNRRFPEAAIESKWLQFVMVGAAGAAVEKPEVKLVVFDEAQHTAAPTYHRAVFTQTHAGILGLTATPTRHDDEPLDFERESFSIGYPDLIKLNVLVNPEIVRVKGLTISTVREVNSDDELEQFNTAERDARIIHSLQERHADYKKVVIYAATAKHVEALYRRIKYSNLPQLYDSVAWVLGTGNSRGEERGIFFEKEKQWRRSILINVALLTEGYDDPHINTVVMAAPCRSKLYYIQAVGRAVRRDPEDATKRAFVLEVVDTLPNIRYKIDNRWLFSDVSDALEPNVVDCKYSDEASFRKELGRLGETYPITNDDKLFEQWDPDERYTLLLFKRYVGNGEYRQLAVPIDKATRLPINNAFNYLSKRMPALQAGDIPATQARLNGSVSQTPLLGEQETFAVAYQAMRNQQGIISGNASADFVQKGYPWITFVSFRFWRDSAELPADIVAFIEPCLNRDELLIELRARTYSPGSHLVRLPLPVKHVIGRIMTNDDVATLQDVVESLRLASETQDYSQADTCLQVLSRTAIPLETKLHCSLIHIVRDNYEWQKAIP